MLRAWIHIIVSGGLLLLSLGSSVCSAQEDFESVDELKEEAEERFEEKKFVEAMPLYSQLLSHQPEDPIYNYKYGVCVLHGSADKEKALKHLEYASKKEEVPPKVHYYLGKAHHLNYRFDKAIEAYERFKEKGDADELPVDQKLRMAKSGRDLLQSPNELVVLDKTRTGMDEFFRYYEPEGVNGRILVAPDNIRKEGDMERGHKPLIFFPSGSKTIYYSSHGADEDQDKDLYKVKQLPNGEWAEPQKLKGAVNTEMDEDYPFKPPNSRNLYFCSKGHNSMGGYDIFRSRFNKEKNRYEAPENLDFPINSPDEDFLYIADEEQKVAYFASGRSSDADHLHVYKVRIEKIPMQLAIIKGRFKNKIDTSELEARIEVRNAETNKKVGVFNSSPDRGEYLITVPKSGKYKFLVNPSSSEFEHEGTVEVPQLEELRPLKQRIILKQEGGREQLSIENRFDERFENEDAILSQVMKNKGKLDVNDSETMRKKLEEAAEQEKEAEAEEEEAEELITKAQKEAEELRSEAERNEERSTKAFAKAEEEKEEAKSLNQKAQERLKEAEANSDPEVRKAKLEAADSLQKEASELAERARNAYELGEKLQEKATQQRKAADRASDYAQELDQNLEELPREKALEASKSKRSSFEKARKKAKGGVSSPSSLDQGAEELEAKAERQLQKGQKKRYRRAKQLKDRLSSIERQLETASGDKEDELKKERNSLQEELERVEAEADSAFAKAERLQEQADRKAAQASMLGSIDEGEGVDDEPSEIKEWKVSEVEELEASIDRTIERNQEQAKDPLLAEHRSEDGKEDRSKGDQSEKGREDRSERDESEEGKGTKAGRGKARGQQDRAEPRGSRFEERDPKTREAIQKADPSYEKEIDKIRSNEELEPLDRQKRVKERKKKLSKNLKERIEKKEASLKNSSDEEEQKELERSIEALEEAREDLQREIRPRGEAASEEGSERSSETLEAYESNERDEVKELDPDYESDIGAIQEAPDLTRKQKRRAIREREDSLARRLEAGIREREQKLAQSSEPEREESLGQELEELRDARNELEAQRKARRSGSEVSGTVDTGDEETEAEGKEATSEEASSDETLAEKEGAESDEETEAEGTEATSEEASSDETLAEEEGAESGESDSDREKAFEGSKSELNEEEKALLEEEAPAYDKDIQQIESSERTRIEKDLEHAKRTEELVEKLEERIDEEREALKDENDPEALKELNQRIENLKELRDKKEAEAERYRARASGEVLAEGEEQESEKESNGSPSDTEEGRKGGTEDSEDDAEGRAVQGDEETEPSGGERSIANSKIERTIDEMDPSYRSDMERIEEEEGAGTPSYFDRKADRARKAEEKAEARIDSLEAEALKSKDPQEAQELDRKIQELEAARKELNARERSYRAYSGTQSEEGSSIEARKELEKDLQALDRSELSQEEKRDLKHERRQKALEDIDRRIEEEKRIRDSHKGRTQRRAEERLKELKEARRNVAEKRAGEEGAASRGKEQKSSAREKAEAFLEERTSNEEEEEEMAREEARKARSYARKKEREAERLRKELREGQEDSDEEGEEGSRERLQAMVHDSKADSARRRAKGYEMASGIEGSEEASTGQEEGTKEVGGDVVAVEDEEDDGEGNGGRESGDQNATEEGSEGQESTEQEEGTEAVGGEVVAVEDERDEEEGSGGRESGDQNATEEGNEGQESTEQEEGTEAVDGEVVATEGESGRSETGEGDPAEASESEGERDPVSENEGGTEPIDPLSEPFLSMEDPEMIEKSEGPVFEETEGSPYSEGRPIPEDPPMPSGVIYQVQVGAFRGTIPQDHFKGFAPLIGKTGDDGITRYRAGFFEEREEAEKAKEKIRAKGYSDAFVVAYEGGERITLDEAARKSSEALASSEETGGSGRSEGSDEAAGSEEEGRSESSSASIEEMKGLFFTVQVGVYSDPLEEGEALQGIGPLYVKRTSNGNHRYSTGVFSSLDEARAKVDGVKRKGINDAFITAYSDGERVTIDRARELIETKGEGILRGKEGTAPGERERGLEEGGSEGSEAEKEEGTEEGTPTETSGTSIPIDTLDPEDIEIRVDLGTYEGNVPNQVAQVILGNSDAEIKERELEGDRTNFRTKSYSSLREANQIRRKFVKKGIEEASIITLVDGEQIPPERAAEVLKEEP